MKSMVTSFENIYLDAVYLELRKCRNCGKLIKTDEELCLDCQIENFISECAAQTEM